MSENPFRDVRKKIGTSSSSFGLVRDGRSIKIVHETPEIDPRQMKFGLLFWCCCKVGWRAAKTQFLIS